MCLNPKLTGWDLKKIALYDAFNIPYQEDSSVFWFFSGCINPKQVHPCLDWYSNRPFYLQAVTRNSEDHAWLACSTHFLCELLHLQDVECFHLLDVPQTQATHGKGSQTGREGDVALGPTNDLDTAAWISLTSIAASKRTSLSLRIHMATVELQRI